MRLLTAISLFATAVSVIPAYALPHRQALIFGNDNYSSANALKNARNDASAVAAALSSLGYTTVLQLDADRKVMSEAIATFADGLKPGDLALLYYSGHGLQVDGENYLVPTDYSRVTTPDEVRTQGISLSAILNEMEKHGATTQIIILDACRDNPFLATRSVKGGWADVAGSPGTFLAFGTAPGSTASDNPGEGHGLFTQAFLKYLGSQMDINDLFESVRADVIRESNSLQIPWVATSLAGPLHLSPQLDPPLSAPFPQLPRSTRSETESLAGIVSPRSAVAQPATTASSNSTNSVGVLVKQGVLLAQQENYQEAVRSLSAALALDPHCSIALRIIGLIFHLMGRSTDAIGELDQALTSDPQDSRAYYYRCLITLPKDPVSAIKDCEAAVGLEPRFAPAHIGLSNAFLMLGQVDKAYSEAQTAIQLNPTSPRGYSMRGRVETSLGKYLSAQEDYSQAVRLSSSDPNH